MWPAGACTVVLKVPRPGAPSLAVTVWRESIAVPLLTSSTSVASNTLAVPLTVNVVPTVPPLAGFSTRIGGTNVATSSRVSPMRPPTSTRCTDEYCVSV